MPSRSKKPSLRYAIVRCADGAYLADTTEVPWTWTRDLSAAGKWRFTSAAAARRLKSALVDGLIDLKVLR